ncbi:MAG: acylphosphatase [Candidatus Thermoplasmatota archaeon]
MAQAHVMISGKVQGVWFRASTKQKADQLGVTGWVRNTEDGCVEAVFSGDKTKVEEMIAWCYQGPPDAQVTRVDVTHTSSKEVFTEFTIKR